MEGGIHSCLRRLGDGQGRSISRGSKKKNKKILLFSRTQDKQSRAKLGQESCDLYSAVKPSFVKKEQKMLRRHSHFQYHVASVRALSSVYRFFSAGTHVDRQTSLPKMIDVGSKTPTARTAMAEASIALPPCVVRALRSQLPKRVLHSSNLRREFPIDSLSSAKKGAIIVTAIVAGTQAVKQTSNLIPFCHPLAIEKIHFEFTLRRLLQCSYNIPREITPPRKARSNRAAEGLPALELLIRCTVAVSGKTGVEMEALTGAAVASLTVYDMLKGLAGAQQAGLGLAYARVVVKRGGKSDIHQANRP